MRNVRLILRQSLTNDGMLIETIQSKYKQFCDWINWNKKVTNIGLLEDLNSYLKIKVLEEVKECRSDIDTRIEKISNLGDEILELSEKNPFYIEEMDNYIECDNYFIEEISSFSKKIQHFGIENTIYKELLINLFCKNEQYMKSISFKILSEYSKEIKDEFLEKLYHELEESTFSLNLNEDVHTFLRYRDFDSEKVQKLIDLTASIKHLDVQWEIGKYAMIYIDEMVFKPQFTLDKDCVQEVTYLTHEEIEMYIDKNCKKDKIFYMRLLNGLELECTEAECYEFIKESKLKLKVRWKMVQAKEQFGLVVYLT